MTGAGGPARQLSRRLTLERSTRAADGAGGTIAAWVPLGQLWAEVTPLVPREGDTGGAPTLRRTLRIVVRGAPEAAASRPQPGQRFREGARLYPIDSVAEADPLGRFLLCLAHEEATP